MIAYLYSRFYLYYFFVAFLLLLGVTFSSILTYNYFTYLSSSSSGEFIDLLCSSEGYFNCANVSYGKYSSIWGFPVSLIGLGFYLIFALYYFIPMFNLSRRQSLVLIFFIFLFIANLFDLFLLFLSIFVIGNVCLQCVVLYVVNLLLILVFYFYEFREISIFGYFMNFKNNLFKSNIFRKDFSIFSIISIFLFGSLYFWSSKNHIASAVDTMNVRKKYISSRMQKLEKRYYSQKTLKIDVKNSPVVGFRNAPIEIIVFHDLQCPHCQTSFFALENLAKSYDNLVKIIYMNYPFLAANKLSAFDSFKLTSFSLLANEKGYYNNFLTELFVRFNLGRYIDNKVIEEVFKVIGYEMSFEDITKKALLYKDEINRQKILAKNLYIESGQKNFGTPGFFLNRKFVKIGYSYDLLKKLIDKQVLVLLNQTIKKSN